MASAEDIAAAAALLEQATVERRTETTGEPPARYIVCRPLRAKFGELAAVLGSA